MPTFDRSVIYLGNIGTPSVFSAPNFIGNEYTGDNAFVTTITVNENFSNDQQVVLDTNGTNVETISYFGGTHEVFDAGYFRATVTQTNGTVETEVRVGIFYTDTGDVFLNEFGENGQLDNRAISSIAIDRKVSINFINADVSSNLVGTSFGPTTPPPATNTAPVLTNANPGEFINTPENQIAVRNIDAFDADGDSLSFSIIGGADAGRFTINSATGQLDFISAPDFEGENSAIGNDDIYDVTVQVSDGRGGVDTANLFINVTDVPEGGTSPDGAVDGENFDEVMTPGYDDSNAPTNNGGDVIDGPDGVNDLIFGNGGNDTINAGAGDDVVFGDAGPGALGVGGGSSTRLDVGSLSGNTLTTDDGSVRATVDFGAPGGFGGWQAIPVGFNSARDELFYATGVLETRNSTLTLNFDAAVEGVSFTIFDVNAASWDDKVTVVGVAEDGSIVPVVFTDVDDQFVNGNVIEGRSSGSTARGAELNENNLYNVTANIADPIVQLRVILESQDGGPSASGYVALGDFQLTPASVVPETFQEILEAQDVAGGDDVLQGNPGSDQLWGEGGNDTIVISSAADGAGDIVVGGNGPNPFTDNDTLDLRGAGQVTINAGADATDAGAQAGTVTFQDGSTLQFFQIETILADPDNAAPSFTNVSQGLTVSVDENTSFVVDADATDPDGDPLTFAITGGADAGRFQIDPATGVLSFTSAPDFEGEQSAIGDDDIYDVQISVSDPSNLSDTVDLFVNVVDVNEAPTITNAADVPVSENVTGPIADIDAVDPDDDPVTFSLAGPDADDFSIDPTNGELSFVGSPDFENPTDADGDNTYDVQVVATDPGGLTDVEDVSVTVADVNEAPNAEDDPGLTTDSNTPLSINVAGNDTDPDNDALTISAPVLNDPSFGTVAVVGNEVVYTPSDAAIGITAEITYTATDPGGLSDTATAFVFVTDGNAAPTITNAADVPVDENVTGPIADIDAVDPDGDPVVFSLAGPDADDFTINPVTGELSFVDDPDFENPTDADGDNTYDVQVIATDPGGLTDVEDISVTVGDVNEAPDITNAADVQVGEDVTGPIADIDAVDPDGDPVVFSLSGPDADDFTINPVTGELSFVDDPDFENPTDADGDNTYDVQVVATDPGRADRCRGHLGHGCGRRRRREPEHRPGRWKRSGR